MTRTVFDNSMTAHVWAQRSQNSGKSGNGNFHFEGPFLFSCGSHFLVGYALPDGRALLNGDRYSVSTSRHQSDAWQAVLGSAYHVPNLTEFLRVLEEAERAARHPARDQLAAEKAARVARAAALSALRAGQPFHPTPEQSRAANMPYTLAIWTLTDQPPGCPAGYQPRRDIRGDLKAPERTTLGWVKPSEFGPGLLGRKVSPDDPHGYGGKWWAEDVPRDVLEWLASLPLPPEGVEIPRLWKAEA